MGCNESKPIPVPIDKKKTIKLNDLISINNKINLKTLSENDKYKWLYLLTTVPPYVNYEFRKRKNDPNDNGEICEIYNQITSSNTSLSDHIKLRGVTDNCILVLNDEQYKIYQTN